MAWVGWFARGLTALFVTFAISQAAWASAPAVRAMATGLLDPTSAEQFYGAADVHTNGLCTLSASACGVWRSEAIRDLARTLSRNQTLSQEEFAERAAGYVRANVATEFRYGLSKGGFGALIDASGTPFDQAQLLVEILRAGNAAASYQAGAVTMTGADFTAWTGISTAQAACRLLADGGIPAIINTQSSAACAYTGAVSEVTLSHVWVSVGGRLYDPSFKKLLATTTADIPTILQCASACGAQAQAAAIPAGRSGNDGVAGYIQNLDTDALGAKLNGYARKFQAYVETNNPNASLAEIIGGRIFDPAYTPAATTSLPYKSFNPLHTWTEIPDQYRSRLQIAFDAISVSLFADETTGNWLHIGGTTLGVASTTNYKRRSALFLEREAGTNAPVSSGLLYSNILNAIADTNQIVLLGAADFNATSSYMTVALTMNHPYAAENGAYGDQQIVQSLYLDSNTNPQSPGPQGQLSPIYIVQVWGDVGRGQIDRMSAIARSKEPLADRRFVSGASFPQGGPPILNHVDIPGVVSTWLAQSTMAASIIDRVNRTQTQLHHTLGTVLELPTGAYAIDAETSYSTASLQASAADREASALSTATLLAVLEGAAIEQAQDLGSSWASIALFKLANRKSFKFYDVTPANLEAVLAASVNYTEEEKSILRTYTGEQYSLVLPQNGDLGSFGQPDSSYSLSWSPFFGYKAGAASTAYMSSLLKGAGAPSALPVNPTPAAPSQAFAPTLNLVDGAVLIDMPPDLSVGVGEFPRKLEFRRSYNSANVDIRYHVDRNTMVNIPVVTGYATTAGHLRLGWSHNFEISAAFSNDGAAALGQHAAREASNAVALVQVLRDLNLSPTFASRLTGVFAASWFSDQVSGNSVVVRTGARADRYARLPNGEFRAEPGKTGKLAQIGARTEVINSSGHHFAYNFITLALTKSDGSTQNFSSAVSNAPSNTTIWGGNGFRIDNWTFPAGDRLNFTYKVVDNTASTVSGDSIPALPQLSVLTRVENAQGRSLTFDTSTAVNNVSDPDGYNSEYLVVSDGLGHKVSFRDKTPDFVAGFKAPEGTKVILPDGRSERIDYDAPSPTMATAAIRVRALYAPTSFSVPQLKFDYDGSRRVSLTTDALDHKTTYYPARVAFGWGRAAGERVGPSKELTRNIFDSENNLIQAINPLGAKTQYLVDNARQTVRVTAPEFNQTRMDYDARGNVLSVCRLPKPASLPDPDPDRACTAANGAITTTTVYGEARGVLNCDNWVLCNRVRQELDARSNTTDYEWDPSTGDLTKLRRPADDAGHRPQTDFAYATKTSSSNVSFTVLQSKTDRISEDQNGVVKSVTTSFDYDANNKFVLKSATVDPNGIKSQTCYHFDPVGNLDQITDPRAGTCP